MSFAATASEGIARRFDAIGQDWTLRVAGAVTGDRAAGKVARARTDHPVRVIPTAATAEERTGGGASSKTRRVLLDARSLATAGLAAVSAEDRISDGSREYAIEAPAPEPMTAAYWILTARAA